MSIIVILLFLKYVFCELNLLMLLVWLYVLCLKNGNWNKLWLYFWLIFFIFVNDVVDSNLFLNRWFKNIVMLVGVVLIVFVVWGMFILVRVVGV